MLTLIAFTLNIGCNVPEAPEDLDQLSSYLFLQMDNPNQDYMTAGVDNLATWMADNRETLNEGYQLKN